MPARGSIKKLMMTEPKEPRFPRSDMKGRMDSAQWRKIKSAFSAVAELPLDERAAFLQSADPLIREEVEKLLDANENAGDFINAPVHVENGRNSVDDKSMVGRDIDDYVILEKLGEGGMGTVYLAEHRGHEFLQRVALKLIKRGMDTNAVLKRFFVERQILASLDHPNIARLLDGGSTENGLPYFVMELVEGENIRNFCDGRQYDTNERLRLFQKVCHAISHAHQKLVVHRDIKPSNIVVTESGEPKLLDFGIAKLLGPDWDTTTNEATATSFRLMTPEYASPEQLRGQMTTTATDVYSLGVVLYELLTGARPYKFSSKDPFEISREILTIEPLRPSSVVSHQWSVFSNGKVTDDNYRSTAKDQRPKTENQSAQFHIPQSAFRNLKGDLDNIILKAIRKDANDRYRSVEELSEDIDRYLNGLPVRATADTTLYRVKKFVQRHKRGVIAGAIVAGLIAIISAIAVWQGVVAVRERDKANARFLKLRETAKSLMYETRDSLDAVPGTIKLREELSEKSVELLESVYDENGDDPVFFKELADSFEKLCRTKLWEFRDLEGSKRSCERAIEIRRKTVELEPAKLHRKIELADTLSTFTELLHLTKDRDLLSENRKEIERLRREIVEKQPDVKNLLDLAQHLLGFVGTYKERETITDDKTSLNEAADIFQKIIDSEKGRSLSPGEPTDLAWTLICQGLLNRKLQNDDIAKNYFQDAAAIAEDAYKKDNSLQLAFNYANIAHRNLGEIYESEKSDQEALKIYRHSLDWLKLRENVEAQSKPNLAWRVSNSANRCALILFKMGKRNMAERFVNTTWRRYSDFLNAESNAASLVYAEEPLDYLSNYYAESGQLTKAITVWQDHLARIQRFLDKNPGDVGFINYQASTEYKMAALYAGKNHANAKSRYIKALELYQRAYSLYSPSMADSENLIRIKDKIGPQQ